MACRSKFVSTRARFTTVALRVRLSRRDGYETVHRARDIPLVRSGRPFSNLNASTNRAGSKNTAAIAFSFASLRFTI